VLRKDRQRMNDASYVGLALVTTFASLASWYRPPT